MPVIFSLEGSAPIVNAARAFASRGIAVLQLDDINGPTLGKPNEADVVYECYVSALDLLAEEGLIDRTRVGVIGFSRTGWYALDSLAFHPAMFAVATLAEGTNMSFGEFLMSADRGQTSVRIEGIMEARPYGAGMLRWIERSPGFNIDKIRAPVLFQVHNPAGLILRWDIYSMLRL